VHGLPQAKHSPLECRDYFRAVSELSDQNRLCGTGFLSHRQPQIEQGMKELTGESSLRRAWSGLSDSVVEDQSFRSTCLLPS
jgi:hypothetical protein